jgi:hypothetical protein
MVDRTQVRPTDWDGAQLLFDLLKPGDRITIRFSSRGTRLAVVQSMNRAGNPVIIAYDSKGIPEKPRSLKVHDLVHGDDRFRKPPPKPETRA